MNSINFLFRVIVNPVDGDPPEIASWVHEHSVNKSGKGINGGIEWVSNSLNDTDFREEFKLQNPESTYEILGKGKITGCFDYFGEYDEDIDFYDTSIKELPKDWYKTTNHLTLNDELIKD